MTAPVRDQAWRNQAACAGSSHPEWWDDAVDGETVSERMGRQAAAVAVCGHCPVVADCRADRRPWEQGVWGGVAYVRNKNVWGDIHPGAGVDAPSNARAKAQVRRYSEGVDISRPPAVRGAGNTTAGGLASREGAD